MEVEHIFAPIIATQAPSEPTKYSYGWFFVGIGLDNS
jgi:hypothetical protein